MADRHGIPKPLGIYLRDHLGAAVGGIELARRMHNREQQGPFGREIEVLLEALIEDRETLEEVMDQLEIEASTLKKAAGWLGEKVGRLKLNGRIVRHSPLNPVLEFEGLASGISGKRSLWEALKAARLERALSDVDFDALIRRADDQLELVRELHQLAAENALAKRDDRASHVGERASDFERRRSDVGGQTSG